MPWMIHTNSVATIPNHPKSARVQPIVGLPVMSNSQMVRDDQVNESTDK